MDPLLMVVLLVCVLALAVFSFSRATELFAGRFTEGRFQLERGRCPPRLLDELDDVGRLEKLHQVTLSVRSEGGRPKLRGQGLDEGQLQQLRNVVGRFEVSQIRQGRRRA